MATKVNAKNIKVKKLCLVCGDAAKGVNFNALTCLSCKAFFRRNGRRELKDLSKCPFKNRCKINMITRRFCTKCRLNKCFNVGMRKDWILTEEERKMTKAKAMKSRDQRLVTIMNQENCEFDHTNSEDEYFEQSDSDNSESSFDVDESPFSIKEEEYEDNQILFYDDENLNDFPHIQISNKQNIELQNIESIVNQSDTEPSWTALMDNWIFSSVYTEPFSCSSMSGESFDSDIDYLNDDNAVLLDLDQKKSIKEEIVEENSMFDDNTNVIMKLLESSEDLPQTVPEEENNKLMFLKLGFAFHELLPSEDHLLSELTSVCSILHNPYHRIRNYDSKLESNTAQPQQLIEHYFGRLTLMCRRLGYFQILPLNDQSKILQNRLMEMWAIRSVLMYNPDRECWGLIDDKKKVTVMLPLELMKSSCSESSYEKHQNFPSLFMQEWKQDEVIFNLLTIIVLFTPNKEYSEHKEISEYHQCYTQLLLRYLSLKYSTLGEVQQSHRKLMGNIEEMRQNVGDLIKFFS